MLDYCLIPMFLFQGYIQAEPTNAQVVTTTRALAISALSTLAYPHLLMLSYEYIHVHVQCMLHTTCICTPYYDKYMSIKITCCVPLTLSLLSKLEPKFSEADQFDVIKISTDSVFPLPLMVSPKKKEVVVSGTELGSAII